MVPEMAGANIVRVNSTILLPAGCPGTRAVLAASEKLAVATMKMAKVCAFVELDNSELAKADGALSCKSVLF